MALYIYNGLVASRPSLMFNAWYDFIWYILCSDCVVCSSPAHRAPDKKSTVRIHKVLVRSSSLNE